MIDAAMSPRPSSIRVFLAEGRAEGLRLVEKSNWTGLGIVCARADYPRLRKREEWSRPGVYFLTAASESATQQRVYIGEADSVRDRVDNHVRSKDFWTTVIAFTSKDDNLNKGHVRYLEARLLQQAKQADRAAIENGTNPPLPRLSEADRADMEGYLDELLVILPLLGVTAFEVLDQGTADDERLSLRGKQAEATGADTPDGFVVFQGSLARTDEVPSIHGYLHDLRSRLCTDGVLVPAGGHLRFAKAYAFDSPSTAAGVVLGRSANGRLEWKDNDGLTLKQRQAAAINDLGVGTGG